MAKTPRKPKPGKYAHVLAALPRLVDHEPERQDKINAVREAILADAGTTWLPAGVLASEWEAIRDEIDAIEAELSEANLRLEAYAEMIVQQYEAEGITSLKLASGKAVRLKYEPHPKVEDKELFRQWCISNGMERSLQLWPSTMASITKERLANGEEPPDGVKTYGKMKVTF